ncbi:MAG: ECF transporter S component [Christensenellaceae bacterium]|nr:ECF transporter S component [Christensenellaceae bacterium]
MNKKIRTIALGGVLAGLTFLLGLTPIGIIPLGPANVTLMCLPVIIGTLTVSTPMGVLLGGVFGITSVIRAFTAPSALVTPLMGVSPLLVIIMSVASRLIFPAVAGLVYKGVSAGGTKREKRALILSSAAGSLANTVSYLGLMLLFYALCGLDSAAVLGVIAGVGALNGSLEAVAAVLICVPVVLAVKKSGPKKK